MKPKTLLTTFSAFLLLGLLVSSFVSKESRIEEKAFPFQRSYSLKGQSKEKAMGKAQEWMRTRYGAENMIISKNQLVAYGSFYVISRTFLGKTTKTCYYTYVVHPKGDSLKASVEEVFLSWYQSSQYKGNRGGTQFKALADILPLEKKVPLEKRAYRHYLEQMEEHFEKIFQQTERLAADTLALGSGQLPVVSCQ